MLASRASSDEIIITVSTADDSNDKERNEDQKVPISEAIPVAEILSEQVNHSAWRRPAIVDYDVVFKGTESHIDLFSGFANELYSGEEYHADLDGEISIYRILMEAFSIVYLKSISKTAVGLYKEYVLCENYCKCDEPEEDVLETLEKLGEKMLIQYYQYRREHKIALDDPPAGYDEYLKVRPSLVFYNSVTQRLTKIEKIGYFLSNFNYSKFTEEQWKMYLFYESEQWKQMMRDHSVDGKVVFQMDVIYDFQGFNTGYFRRRKTGFDKFYEHSLQYALHGNVYLVCLNFNMFRKMTLACYSRNCFFLGCDEAKITYISNKKQLAAIAPKFDENLLPIEYLGRSRNVVEKSAFYHQDRTFSQKCSDRLLAGTYYGVFGLGLLLICLVVGSYFFALFMIAAAIAITSVILIFAYYCLACDTYGTRHGSNQGAPCPCTMSVWNSFSGAVETVSSQISIAWYRHP